MTLTLTSGNSGYLAIFVDGQSLDRARYEEGTQTLVIAEDLPEGRHTIRIPRDSDLSSVGARLVLSTLELDGEDLQPTPEKSLYIEFVGDSITTGKGVMAPGTYNADDPKHAATPA